MNYLLIAGDLYCRAPRHSR